MFRLFIAYDGSPCSDAALFDLRRAGLPKEADVLLFSAADVRPPSDFSVDNPYTPPEYTRALEDAYERSCRTVQEAETSARKAQETLRRYFPHWRIETKVAVDSPAGAVMDQIASWRPDLVVMGSHGRAAIGRLLFGSVSHAVLTQVHCNLRIARGRDENGTQDAPLRVVVAYDGSQEAQTAFEAALCRRWPKGTAMRLIAVMDTRLSLAFLRPSGPIRYWVKEDDKDPQQWIRRMLSDHKKRIEEKGLIAYSEVMSGDPKRILLKEAEAWGADTIFVGCRGLTGRERLIAGSVSTGVATHAHCSVEVVHRLWDASVCCDAAKGQHRECMSRESS